MFVSLSIFSCGYHAHECLEQDSGSDVLKVDDLRKEKSEQIIAQVNTYVQDKLNILANEGSAQTIVNTINDGIKNRKLRKDHFLVIKNNTLQVAQSKAGKSADPIDLDIKEHRELVTSFLLEAGKDGALKNKPEYKDLVAYVVELNELEANFENKKDKLNNRSTKEIRALKKALKDMNLGTTESTDLGGATFVAKTIASPPVSSTPPSSPQQSTEQPKVQSETLFDNARKTEITAIFDQGFSLTTINKLTITNKNGNYYEVTTNLGTVFLERTEEGDTGEAEVSYSLISVDKNAGAVTNLTEVALSGGKRAEMKDNKVVLKAEQPAPAPTSPTNTNTLTPDIQTISSLLGSITGVVNNKRDWISTGKRGKKEDNIVYKLQDLLVQLDSKGGFGRLLPKEGKYAAAEQFKDGDFGEATWMAVRNLQIKLFPDDKNEQDGYFGPKTKKALEKKLGVSTSEPVPMNGATFPREQTGISVQKKTPADDSYSDGGGSFEIDDESVELAPEEDGTLVSSDTSTKQKKFETTYRNHYLSYFDTSALEDGPMWTIKDGASATGFTLLGEKEGVIVEFEFTVDNSGNVSLKDDQNRKQLDNDQYLVQYSQQQGKWLITKITGTNLDFLNPLKITDSSNKKQAQPESTTNSTLSINQNGYKGEYSGAVVNGKATGLGTLVFQKNGPYAGRTYQGQFKDDLPDGMGTLVKPGWKLYGRRKEGKYDGSRKNGNNLSSERLCTLIELNDGVYGDRRMAVVDNATTTESQAETPPVRLQLDLGDYYGNAVDGVPHGVGTLIFKDNGPYAGARYGGGFKNGKFHGWGSFSKSDSEAGRYIISGDRSDGNIVVEGESASLDELRSGKKMADKWITQADRLKLRTSYDPPSADTSTGQWDYTQFPSMIGA